MPIVQHVLKEVPYIGYLKYEVFGLSRTTLKIGWINIFNNLSSDLITPVPMWQTPFLGHYSESLKNPVKLGIQKLFDSVLCCCWRGKGMYFVIIGDPELGRIQQALLRSQRIWFPFHKFPAFLSHIGEVIWKAKYLGALGKKIFVVRQTKYFPPGCYIPLSGTDLPGTRGVSKRFTKPFQSSGFHWSCSPKNCEIHVVKRAGRSRCSFSFD